MTDVRLELVRLMRATLADREHWDYLAVRPMSVPPSWHRGQHVVADCSKAIQFLCRWAGAPDPMGYGQVWGPWGNSTRLAVHLPHLTGPGQLLPGDIVTFGPAGTKHAAMVFQVGLDPTVWSHGHQGAPNLYRLSRDKRVKQYLRLPVAAPSTPDVLVLVRMTGFWSWLKWKQGEGEWRMFGPENHEVRPSVPRMISLKWWLDRERFLANRKKANDPWWEDSG